MKATTNDIKFPGTAKFFAFVALISGLAFLSTMVANAQVSNGTRLVTFIDEVNDSYADVLKSAPGLSGISMSQVWAIRLERALVPATEAGIGFEPWMLDAGFSSEAYEESLELEEWMLDPDYFYSSETFEEAIELEDWMLDSEYYTKNLTDEDPVELEDWMLE